MSKPKNAPGPTPQPTGPHPPVVRPAFRLECEYCREPSRGEGKRHERISSRHASTYYRCWNCYVVVDGVRVATTFKVIREDKLQGAVRTESETT